MRERASHGIQFSWLVAAGMLGFAVSAVFAGGLRWSRSAFLVPYLLLGSAFAILYLRAHPLPALRWVAHWPRAAAAVIVAWLLLWQNIKGQPASAPPQGLDLLAALAWSGVAYGAMDALLLNVLPVLAVGGPPQDPAGPTPARLRQALIALLASLLVTVAYHAGYPEFQGQKILYAVIGNVIITATYLASGSPLAPIATHVVMHVMAVLHGIDTTLQLPPHYGA